MGLGVFLFGSFRLTVDGEEVGKRLWQKRKAKHLVQLLALQKTKSLHREQLVDILFPDLGERAGCDNLYRATYAARRAMEGGCESKSIPGYLLMKGGQMSLSPDVLWVDVDEFGERAAEGLRTCDPVLLTQAADLYKGDLLLDEPLEEWTHRPRARMKATYHSVVRALAELSEMRRDPTEAHMWLDKAIECEAADESAHQAKMRLFHLQGDRTLALRQYERCAEILRRELDVEPEPETEKLRRKIIANIRPM